MLTKAYDHIMNTNLSPGLIDLLVKIEKEYGEFISEPQLIKLTGFCKFYFSNLRIKKNPALPHLKFGKTIKYVKKDVIDYIRNANGA